MNITNKEVDYNDCIWNVVDEANEKLRDMSKDKVIKFFSRLWANKIKDFSKKRTIEEEALFYIKEFNDLTNKKASNFLILYLMT